MSSVLAWLEEYIGADAPVIGNEEVSKRRTALREMLTNYRSMSVVQFQEVMTVAHFSTYFSDALSRMFYDRYKYQVGSWRNYTHPDTTPDFRDVKRFRMSEPGTLHRRREKGQSNATSVANTQVAFGVDEYSRSFDVSWRAILNDDLGAIRQVPMQMVDAAKRFEDKFVSDLYDNATTQAAIVALGALYAGTGRLTEANLAVAITAFMTRTDVNGNLMHFASGLRLVIPPELTITAAKIMESTQIAGSMDNDKNVIPRFIKSIEIDPYITTASPNIPWYLIADPSDNVPTITVARLQGWPGPVIFKRRSDIEMIQGSVPAAFLMGNFDSGNIEYTVEDVIGGWDDATYVGVTDYRGIYYSSGTTA